MKTKRKVHLSGNRWFPIRQFEFSTHKTLDEVLACLDTYRELHLDRKHSSLSRYDKMEAAPYFIFRSWKRARNFRCFIAGNVYPMNDHVIIRGQVGLNDLFWFGIFFCTHFLSVSVPIVCWLLQVDSPLMLITTLILICFVAPFPLSWIYFYTRTTNQREKVFDAFLAAIQQMPDVKTSGL